MCLLLVFGLFVYGAYRLYQHFYPTPDINPRDKYVLISGCDSGFGNGLAIELDKQGFLVLAGVYSSANVDKLKSILSSNATVFQLDISSQDDIDRAFELVSSKTKVLHALVNNAGIGASGMIDWITVDSMRQVMDINFFGHVAMTKTFLPLLIAKRDSRVVNICSVAGYITKPGMSSYAASKYAFESFSDCLRREMAVWNLRVSIIEPGFMRTNIMQGHDKALRVLWETVPESVKQRWGEAFLDKTVESVKNNIFMKYAEDPAKVVRALKHAVMNTTPRIRYRPGIQSSCIMFAISRGPAWLADKLMIRPSLQGALPAGLRDQLAE